MNVIQQTYINGVSTRKIKRLANSLGIGPISRGQVSNITRKLNEQVQAFRNRRLEKTYPMLWVDALHEKIRYDNRVVNMAVEVVIGINTEGKRDILAIEPMLEESEATYKNLFDDLKSRGLEDVWLAVSDAHRGLTKAVRESFVGCTWQRCKVHFMRNILARIPSKDKASFASKLKQIWAQPDVETARAYAEGLMNEYESRCSDY